MSSYGFTANLSYVTNDDTYQCGVNFSDTKKNKFNKSFKGKVDNLEKDITTAFLEEYVKLLKGDYKEADEKSEEPTITPVEHETVEKDFTFDEINEQFDRLMQKFNSEQPAVATYKKPSTSHAAVRQKYRDIDSILDFFRYQAKFFSCLLDRFCDII